MTRRRGGCHKAAIIVDDDVARTRKMHLSVDGMDDKYLHMETGWIMPSSWDRMIESFGVRHESGIE